MLAEPEEAKRWAMPNAERFLEALFVAVSLPSRNVAAIASGGATSYVRLPSSIPVALHMRLKCTPSTLLRKGLLHDQVTVVSHAA